MKSFFNKILVVNLNEKRFETQQIKDEVYEGFLGGKGLGIYLMLERNKTKVDAFSPENNLIICTGPVNDTGIWGSSRYAVITKSPLTGFLSHSYSGGNVAEPISRTGYDTIVLEGKSEAPVFLEINEKDVIFHDASQIWGADTYKTEDYIADKTGKNNRGIIVIGPAGENLVRFANITNNRWRCAGRTGTGAVLGSKNVKGIAFHGSQKRQTAYPEAIQEFHDEWRRRVNDYPSAATYRRIGTPGLVSIINTFEAFPARYWYDGKMDGWEAISGETLHANFSVKPHACTMCLLACGRMTSIQEGRFSGLRLEGPEYETIYAFGGLCLIKKLDEIMFLNDLCDRLGIDTITAGNLCAFSIEASRMGRIKEKISYGDIDGIADLIGKIARREGTGAVLAEGITFAAKEWSMEDIAIHVKGMEPAGYDPRYFKGMGLAYATSDRGACHLRSTVFRAEASGVIPPDQIEGKAEIFIDFEDRLNLHDSLILCRFYRDLYLWDELARIIHITTGMDVTKDTLRKIASNIQNAARRFNIREGLTRQDDTLPRRFFNEPIGSNNNIITEQQLEYMKDDYYRLRGWDEMGNVKGNI